MISFFRSVVVLVTMLWWCLAWAQTDYTFNDGYSTRETAQKAHDDADLNRAVQAYRVLLPDRLMRGPLYGTGKVRPRRQQGVWDALS
jgi:hypothetical protein